MIGTFLPLRMRWYSVNSAGQLMLGIFGLLPPTVLIQIDYRKGEGYAKTILVFCQAQQIYKFNPSYLGVGYITPTKH